MESVVPAWAAGDAAAPPPAWSDTERSDRRSAAVALRPPRWKRSASKRMPSPGLSGQMASCRPSRRRARRSASESAWKSAPCVPGQTAVGPCLCADQIFNPNSTCA